MNPDLSFLEQFMPIGNKMALKFALSYKIENRMDELMSEVCWALLNAPSKYKPEFKGKKIAKCTFAYIEIYWTLLDFCRAEVSHKPVFIDLEQKMGGNKERSIKLKDVISHKESFMEKLYKEIGEEGKALIQIILDCPEDLHIIKPRKEITRKHLKDLIKSYLIDVMDWNHMQFNDAWKEVETCLSVPG